METKEKLRGLNTVRVNITNLLDEVENNRQKHAREFEEAYEGWKVQVYDQMEEDLKKQREQTKKTISVAKADCRKVVKDAKEACRKKVKVANELLHVFEDRFERVKGGDFLTDVSIFKTKKPQHHIEDYNGTIKKLKLSLDDELELSSTEFDQYVMDQWVWKEEFQNDHLCMSGSLAAYDGYSISSSPGCMVTGSLSYSPGFVSNMVLNNSNVEF